MKPRIYIAGKMRGCPHYNFIAFDTAKLHLQEQGWHVISPADIDRLFEGWPLYPPEGAVFEGDAATRFIRRDLDLLLSLNPATDAIYLLKNWELSRGARAEKAVAEFRGLTVIYEGD